MVKWTKTLESGIPGIDKQHKELVEKINELLDATRSKKGKEEVINIFEFLSVYVQEHFEDEEKLLLKYNYPKFDEHKKLHDNFVENVKRLLKEYLERGEAIDIVIKINGVIMKWLIDHIMKVDREYIKYFDSMGIKAEF